METKNMKEYLIHDMEFSKLINYSTNIYWNYPYINYNI